MLLAERPGGASFLEAGSGKGGTWRPNPARVSFEDLTKDLLRDYKINGKRSIGKPGRAWRP